jgi:hypothetical protein
MKTIFQLPLIAALAALLATSCTSYRYTANINQQDDIYFSPREARAARSQTQAPVQQNRSGQNTLPAQSEPAQSDLFDEGSVVDGSGNIINNYYGDVYFDSDDYYDYAYAARIRRFHNPNMAWGYYDPFFTNMYFYNYDPFFFGNSIYMTYGFWNPNPWGWGWGMGPGWGWHSGWGWGGGWGGWGMMGPGWGWGMGPGWGWGGNYWAGYNHGYWHGYQNGLANNYYFNSFDRNSHYHGPRNNSTGSGSALTTNSRNGGGRLAQAYQQQVGLDNRTSATRNNLAQKQLDNGAIGRQSLDTRAGAGDVSRNNVDPVVRSNQDIAARPNSGATREAVAADRSTDVRDRRGSVTPSDATRTATEREGANGRIESQNSTRGSNISASERVMTPQRATPQERPSVKPVPAPNRSATAPAARQPQNNSQAQPQRQATQPGNANRAPHTYNAPKRNPHAYQPHAAPGTEHRNLNNSGYQRQHSGNTPSRSGSNSGGGIHSQPSRSSGSYSTPQSSPSRSGGSNHSSPSPSRGGGSFNSTPSPSSSPSRSGGGSFSSPSPSRGGGGGGSFSTPPSRGGSSSGGSSRSPR